MEERDTAYLEIRLATEMETIWQTVALTDAVTWLGRPEVGQTGVDLRCKGISRQHARVQRSGTGEAATYSIENYDGQGGVRLHAQILRPGQQHPLRHGYVFSIPAVLARPEHRSYTLTFYQSQRMTTCLPIQVHYPRYISIFDQLLEFPGKEYDILAYLYTHKNEFCPYAAIIAAMMVEIPRTPERIAAYINQLYTDHQRLSDDIDNLVHPNLSKIRKKIREASGGIDLIETIHGEGLCLRP